MAISISAMSFGTSVSSYSCFRARSFEKSSVLCNSQNPCRFNSVFPIRKSDGASRCSVSR